MKTGKKEEAKRIADYITLYRDAFTPDNDANSYNRIFDIVLNLNMLKLNEGASHGEDLLGFGLGAAEMHMMAPSANGLYGFGVFGQPSPPPSGGLSGGPTGANTTAMFGQAP